MLCWMLSPLPPPTSQGALEESRAATPGYVSLRTWSWAYLLVYLWQAGERQEKGSSPWGIQSSSVLGQSTAMAVARRGFKCRLLVSGLGACGPLLSTKISCHRGGREQLAALGWHVPRCSHVASHLICSRSSRTLLILILPREVASGTCTSIYSG